MDTQNNFLENYTLSGENLDILTLPSPILKKVASPVETFNDDLVLLCKNMLFTMYNSPGIGLAAPQVGKSVRLFVMDIDYDREEITNADGEKEFRLSNFNPLIFINPSIELVSGEIIYEEGCLSVPGIYEEVKRHEIIKVKYQDLSGAHHEITVDGLQSVCIQHENDHLDGIVFLERLSMLKKNFLTKKFLKNKKRKSDG